MIRKLRKFVIIIIIIIIYNLTASRTTANNDQKHPKGRTTAATPTQGQ